MRFYRPELLWLLLLAPLAGIAATVLWRRWGRAQAAWAARGLWPRLAVRHRPLRLALSVLLLVLAVLASALALARPRWGQQAQAPVASSLDVVFVLDSSLSMIAGDVPPSRLETAKALVRQMLPALQGDRVALIQLEGQAEVLAALTPDVRALDLLLDGVAPGSLLIPGTDFEKALPQVLALLAESDNHHRAVILLSDGEDHGDTPDTAITQLRAAGIAVHALGIGTPGGARLPLPGQPNAYKLDRGGQPVISQLQEERLRELATATGGSYQQVSSAGLDPAPLLERLADLRGSPLPGQEVEVLAERYQVPLGLAALALALHLLLRPVAVAPAAARREAVRRSQRRPAG